MIKKQKPLPPIEKEEEPFEIPSSWEWVRLGEVSNFIDYRGKTPKKINRGIRLLTAKNIKNGFLSLEPEEFISIEEHEERSTRGYIKKGSILFTTEAPLGNVAINPFDNIAIAQRTIAIDAYQRSMNSFLFYELLSPKIQFSLYRVATGSTVKGIKAANLKNILIALPSLSEQQRIVSKIEELFAELDKIDKAQETYDSATNKLRDKVLDYAMRGKLVPQDPNDEPASELLKRIKEEKENLIKNKVIKKQKPLPYIEKEEEPFEIPSSWKWVRLGTVSISNIGLTYKPELVKSEGIPVLRANNIQKNRITHKDLIYVSKDINIKNNEFLNLNDVLICVRSGSKSLLGKSALITDKEVNFSFGAFMSKIKFISGNNKFLYYFILSNVFRNQIFCNNNTTVINQITQTMIKHSLISIPPLEEQQRIVSKIEKIILLLEI